METRGMLSMLAILSMSVTSIAADCSAAYNWTECTTECGVGTRSTTDNVMINCHTIDCDFEASCPCGLTDLVFVMDDSNSIIVAGGSNYAMQKQFAVDIVDGTRYSDQEASAHTRVALIRFSTELNIDISLDENCTAAEQTTSDRIFRAEYCAGETYTWVGLDAATDMFHNQGRFGYKWIAIVITDGESNDMALTLEAADRLKAEGAVVYSVGIGNAINVAELNGIASDPDEIYVYTVDDFNNLSDIINDIINGTCCNTYEKCNTTTSACSVTCGPGQATQTTNCTVYNSYDDSIVHQTSEPVQISCNIQACPDGVTEEDCADCEYTNGIGFLQDPADCRCYYMCEKRGSDYTLYPKQCCQTNGTYWNPNITTCHWHYPTSGCQRGNTTFTPAPLTTTTPCRYTVDPDDDHKYTDGTNTYTCPSDWIFSEEYCTCMDVDTGCDTDPLLYYKFDDTFDDVSCTHASTDEYYPVALVAGGKVGNCAYFSGGYLAVPFMRNHFSYSNINHWSVSLWYKRDDTHAFNTNVYMGLVENGDCDDAPSFSLYLQSDQVRDNTFFTTVTTTVASKNNTINLSHQVDLWVHLAMTYDGNYLRVYKNGAKDEPDVALSGYIINTDCVMKMGHHSYDVNDPSKGLFYGWLDEVLVYERTLSAAEITDLYQNPGTS